MFTKHERRRQLMHRSLILAGAVAALALPAVAQATDEPTSTDRANAAQECRYERGSTEATREAFAAKYRAFGKCVSAKARDEASERDHAESNAAHACKAERGTTAESRKAFGEKYGTNAKKANAMGKCVSQTAKAGEDKADAQDREQAAKRKRAAKRCAHERAASRAAFGERYGTKANAFGKCVSKAAKAKHGDG
jgi:hypothetical protein